MMTRWGRGEPSTPRSGFRHAALALGCVLAFCASFARAADDQLMALINSPERAAAPSFDGAVAWINTEKPLTPADLKGKIVLLDFWTFG